MRRHHVSEEVLLVCFLLKCACSCNKYKGIQSKSDDGIIEFIYKEKEAGSGALITTRKISSSKDIKIVVPLPSNKFEGGVQLVGGDDPLKTYLKRKQMFQVILFIAIS